MALVKKGCMVCRGHKECEKYFPSIAVLKRHPGLHAGRNGGEGGRGGRGDRARSWTRTHIWKTAQLMPLLKKNIFDIMMNTAIVDQVDDN